MRGFALLQLSTLIALIAGSSVINFALPAAGNAEAAPKIGDHNEPLRVALQPKKRLPGGPKVLVEKDSAKRNDMEGAVWQYTATQSTKGKELNGEFRIKGRAIFAPAKDFDDGSEESSKETSKKASRRTDDTDVPKGEKRVGDVIANERSGDGEMQLVFTHYKKLDGRAVVKRQGKAKSTANLVGYFQAKDGQRWKFELRRAED